MKKIRPYQIEWRGVTTHVEACVHVNKKGVGCVQIFSLHEQNARDSHTFVSDNPTGEGDEARALSDLTPEERKDLYDLVWNEHLRVYAR